MTLAEVLPAARALCDKDKLRLIRVLADDMDRENAEASLLPTEAEYPVWSPCTSYEAAAVLQSMLKQPPEAT